MSGVLSRRRLALVGALAGVGFAAAYGYAPDLVPAAIRAPLSDLDAADRRIVLGVVGAVVGVLGLLYAWAGRRETAPSPLADRRYERSTRGAAVAGEDLSAAYRRAVETGEDGATADALRRRLREAVVEIHRPGTGDRDAAEALVDRGEWTDDRYAAAFLTTTADVDYPWYHRLYAWLYPGRAFERRIDRALRAVEAACGERSAGYEPPATDGTGGRLRVLRRVLEGDS